MLHLRVCISWVGFEMANRRRQERMPWRYGGRQPPIAIRSERRKVSGDHADAARSSLPSGMRLVLRFQPLGLQRAWADSAGQDASEEVPSWLNVVSRGGEFFGSPNPCPPPDVIGVTQRRRCRGSGDRRVGSLPGCPDAVSRHQGPCL